MVSALKVTDLAYSRALGICPAPAGADHLLELPFGPLVQNHVGSVHAAAQFSLAEAASAECLQRRFGREFGEVFAVVRGVSVKYRKLASGDLLAFGTIAPETESDLPAGLAARGRAGARILIDLKDRDGTLVFHGEFEWFISRVPPTAS